MESIWEEEMGWEGGPDRQGRVRGKQPRNERERETEIRQPKTSGGDCPKEANGYYHGLNGKQILGFFKRIAL